MALREKTILVVSDEFNRYKLNKYEPLFVFKDERNDSHAWRVVVYNKSLYEDVTKIESVSEIRFISSKAPSDCFKTGKEFELYDGPVLLAEGIITDIEIMKY